MTRSIEPAAGSSRVGEALGLEWRARALAEQRAALPSGDVVVSCPAPFGGGGLGRHLQEIAEALDALDARSCLICEGPRMDELPARRATVALATAGIAALAAPCARLSPPWSMWRACLRFDARAARRMPRGGNLIAFSGSALTQLRQARRAGYASMGLVSPTSHIRHVSRRYALAYRRYPLERPWSARMLGRALAEYELSERIYVSTRHVRESFLEQGIADERLAQFPLTPHPRFTTVPRAERAPTFDVLYVGALSVAKGVPLLVEAFGRLAHPDMRLILHGGWASRGMRRFMERACAADARVEVRLGDPAEAFATSHLYVHPSYEDGFGYAPAEALACGMPVVVSEDTGMNELIDAGRTGAVVPTGDLDALAEALEAGYRGELLHG